MYTIDIILVLIACLVIIALAIEWLAQKAVKL